MTNPKRKVNRKTLKRRNAKKTIKRQNYRKKSQRGGIIMPAYMAERPDQKSESVQRRFFTRKLAAATKKVSDREHFFKFDASTCQKKLVGISEEAKAIEALLTTDAASGTGTLHAEFNNELTQMFKQFQVNIYMAFSTNVKSFVASLNKYKTKLENRKQEYKDHLTKIDEVVSDAWKSKCSGDSDDLNYGRSRYRSVEREGKGLDYIQWKESYNNLIEQVAEFLETYNDTITSAKKYPKIDKLELHNLEIGEKDQAESEDEFITQYNEILSAVLTIQTDHTRGVHDDGFKQLIKEAMSLEFLKFGDDNLRELRDKKL